jgi:hypothetical protein
MKDGNETLSRETKEVQEIAKRLSRAAKNYQMYLSNNRMFLTSLDSLENALQDFLEVNETLTLVVHEFELLYENTVVYSNTDKFQSIAFRMYRDGIRLLSFHRGLTKDDILALFDVLTRCMETDNLEEDFVTLLWEKDLQAITYYEVNDFEADYDTLKKEAEKRRGPSRPITSASVAEAPWNKVTAEGDEIKPRIAFTAEDLHEVQDLTLTVDDDLFLRRVCQALRLTIDFDNAKETYLDLERALSGFLDACVAKKQLGLASETLDEVAERYNGFGDQEVGRALARIVKARHTSRNMSCVAEVLAGGNEIEHEHCESYLCKLSPEAIPSVMGLLSHCNRPSARKAVAASLAAIGETCPADIIKCADMGSTEQVELVLDVLEAIGSDAALSSALRFKHDSSARVRARVASLAAKVANKEALETVRSLIEDPDQGVRRRALTSLVDISGDQSTEILMSLYTSKEFHALPHEGKVSMLLAMWGLSSSAQHKVITKIMQTRRFFKRKPLENTKIALVEILHLMDSEVAMSELRRIRDRCSGAIKKAAGTALEKIRDEQRIN